MSPINIIKRSIRRMVLGPKASGEDMIAFLRGKGMTIGENTVIHDVTDVFIDPSRPWMVTIGDNVQITRGVTILTHGYDWSVFKGLYGDVLGSAGHVSIGSNVFIGMNATILKGVNIGNNVVIGANSLINKDVPDNCVVAGNPQRIICGIDEYLEKRRKAQLSEAADLYRCWRANTPAGKAGEVPPKRNSMSSFGCLRILRRASKSLSTKTSCIFVVLTTRARSGSKKQKGRFQTTNRSFNTSIRPTSTFEIGCLA